ncbi:MAG TPA: efflux RND transporter permease subunit [Chitinivibrionales bacterium]|jgi:hydrophobe/amphiphile efflux-1 (HAE1) family protein|nr:efflux RND transporter permease subunit [Chitinivibrionales bacterium]
MTLSEFSLHRPVASIVMSLVIVLLGAVGFNFLGIRLYPAIDPPVINVRTNYTGANSDIIESRITEPLEKAINGIEGIKSISSSSATGSCNITVEFNVGADLEKAANDVRDKVSQAARNLPVDIDAPPIVTKADANSDPIIVVSVQSTTMNALELSDYAENILQEKLQTIPGLSSVQLFGQKRPAMRLWLNPDKMAAYNVSPQDVNAVLAKENIELPSGKLTGKSTELIVKTFGLLVTEEDFNNLIIRQTNDQVVRFKDIGEAMLGPENPETGIKFNGADGIFVALLPLPGANTIQVADEFYKRFDEIKKNLPPGLRVDIGYDKSKFVRASVSDVRMTIGIALFLVILIVFLFFRNWVLALRPLLDIPVSLISAFFIMYVFGFSINVLTLLAIVLATGLVVDDGIVVTENIYKKIERGMGIWDACIQGTREVFFVVIATSMTLAVVFIPVIFLQGFTGRLFREFGIVLAGAVLVSAFVALTLTPVLNLKLGRINAQHSNFYKSTEPFFTGMDATYRRILAVFMRRKWLSFVILGVCLGLIVLFITTLKSELAPLEDHSLIRANITLPEGTSFDYTQNLVDRVAQLEMDSIAEARLLFAGAGLGGGATNTGAVQTFLVEPNERKATQQQIYDRLSKMYKRFPAARVIPIQEQTISTSLSAGRQLPVQFVVQNLDFGKLQEALPKFLDEARSDPVFGSIDVDLKFNKPEVDLTINRLKATDLGVNVVDVSTTLDYALSGRLYEYYLRNGKQYEVIGQVERSDRDKPADITSLYVRNNAGNLIQLDNLVSMTENSSPPTLYHYNRYKSATVSATLAQGKALGEGIVAMRRIAKKMLDGSFHTELSGPSRDFAESSSNTLFALVLALLFIYLILAFQFESFREPFIIMLTVPLAIAGAMLSLGLFGMTLNIFSEIGMIMLIGLVTKNGILIVEFANQKRKAGLPKLDATMEAAAARLRPILMTSLATIFGALPITLGLGMGAESRKPLGVVVDGGLLFALILTLFVIPVMYTMMSKDRKEVPGAAATQPKQPA